MGREPRQGRGMPAGGKNQQASLMEWEVEGGAVRSMEWQESPLEWGETEEAARPTEWRKTPGGTAREWEGKSSRRRASTPPEWMQFTGETKPPEWTPMTTD